MFDSAGTVHGIKKMPYSLFELQTKAGPGKTKLVKELKLSDEMLAVPPWPLYSELEHLPAWLEALNQQYYGLSLGPVTNEVWAQKLREQANSVFTWMLLLLYKTCRVSSGAQLLQDFMGGWLSCAPLDPPQTSQVIVFCPRACELPSRPASTKQNVNCQASVGD